MDAAATTPRRIAVVVGTRPEAIKLAPVVWAMAHHPRTEPLVVATGQQDAMLTDALAELELVPVASLGDGPRDGDVASYAGRLLGALAPVLASLEVDAVLVQGDTTSALVGALAGFYARRPVVHLEAGLRTGDLTQPFPEEGHRRLIASVASLHLAPTAHAAEHLRREGVPATSILVTGNTVVDAARWAIDRGQADAVPPSLRALLDGGASLAVATLHRRESWGEGVAAIVGALRTVALEAPDWHVVFSVHSNPAVRGPVTDMVGDLANVHLVDPLAYRPFIELLGAARFALTDSGGIQEEAPSVGTPVLIARDVTERAEVIDAGWGRLVGRVEADVAAALRIEIAGGPSSLRATSVGCPNPFGDGRAGERSAAAVAWLLDGGSRPEPL